MRNRCNFNCRVNVHQYQRLEKVSSKYLEKVEIPTLSSWNSEKFDSTSRSFSKTYLNKIYLKKLKFLLLTGEIVEIVY